MPKNCRKPSFPAVLAQTNQSPYLVELLTQLHARGNSIQVDSSTPNAAFYGSSDRDIHIGSQLLPEVNQKTGLARFPDQNMRFASLIGHEAGHAVLPDRSVVANHPLQARANGLNGEGVALTTEYIVAEQIGIIMWSGSGIQSQLDATAQAQGVDAHVEIRSVSDPAAHWQAFDQFAHQQWPDHRLSSRCSSAR